MTEHLTFVLDDEMPPATPVHLSLRTLATGSVGLIARRLVGGRMVEAQIGCVAADGTFVRYAANANELREIGFQTQCGEIRTF